MGFARVKRLIKTGICLFFHEKEYRLFKLPDEVFTFTPEKYRGCSKCDRWRKVDITD